MSINILVVTDTFTDRDYTMPAFSLQSVAVPSLPEVKRLVNNREIVVGQASWDTQRLLGNATWTLRFFALPDEHAPAMKTARLKSLLLGWQGNGTVLQLSGADFLNIEDEPMLNIGDTPGLVYRTAMPWWAASGEVVTVDGVLVVETTDYTVDRNTGVLTFNSAQDPDAEVLCSVERTPLVRVMNVNPDPQNQFDTTGNFRGGVYGPEVVLHEETP